MKYKKARTLADLRADPRVQEVWKEHDGFNVDDRGIDRGAWWIALKPGWCWCAETHVIHEATLAQACDVFNSIQPCDCKNCNHGKGDL